LAADRLKAARRGAFFAFHGWVSPAVLPPATLVVFLANGAVFAVRDGRDPVGRNAKSHHVVLGHRGSTVAQAKVVLLASSLIAVPFNRELDVRMGFEESGIRRESLLGVGAKVRLVSVEVRILDLALERVQHAFLSNGGRRGWSRSGNRHAGRATGPAAGPASHESVGR